VEDHNTTSVSVAHVITGSNTILATSINDGTGDGANDVSGCKYNNVSMTLIDSIL